MVDVKRWATALVVFGALLTSVGIAPFRYIESNRLPSITSSYILMMVVPAIVAVAPLLYQRARGLVPASKRIWASTRS